MKRFFLSFITLCFLLSGCGVYIKDGKIYHGDDGYVYYSQYYDGYWGEWKKLNTYKPQYLGKPNDFGIGWMSSNPRIYYVKLKVNDFNVYTLKKGGDYTHYTGSIEYTIHADNKISKYNYNEQSKAVVQIFGSISSNETITRPAKFSICMEKRGRIVYNVFFDNVGLAFSIPWDL